MQIFEFSLDKKNLYYEIVKILLYIIVIIFVCGEIIESFGKSIGEAIR